MARDPELDEFVDLPVPPVAPGAKRGPYAAPSSDAPRTGTSTWVVVVAVVGAGGLFLIGILAPLTIYGARRYMLQAKIGEGRASVTAFAQGITRCFAETEQLPETSARVPSELALVSGKKYQSRLDDWSDEAFKCSRFRMDGPQYFQYQWALGDDNQRGKVLAIADLDGDGDPEVRLELDVDCSGESCRVAEAMREVSPFAGEQQ